jgi:FkbM family methyltransferase
MVINIKKTKMLSLATRLFEKTKIQIEDIVWRKNLHESVKIILSVVNRRRIPLPSVVYSYFSNRDENSSDLGDEKFLAEYMIPENGKSFVDVGAAIGTWSLFVAEKGNKVYSFEPSPKSYRILIERAKNYSNIRPYPYALGDKDTVGRLGLAAFSLSGTMDKEIKGLHKGGTIDIIIRSLDSLNLFNIGVIKIDTEGYETPILLGAKKTIEKEKPRLIIEVHKGTGKASETFTEELQKIKTILRNSGYSWVIRCRSIGLREIQPFVIAEPITRRPD